MKHLICSTLAALALALGAGPACHAALTLTLDIEDISVPYSESEQETAIEAYFSVTSDAEETLRVSQFYFGLDDWDSRMTLKTKSDHTLSTDVHNTSGYDWIFEQTQSELEHYGAPYWAKTERTQSSGARSVTDGQTYGLFRIPLALAAGLETGTYALSYFFKNNSSAQMSYRLPRMGGEITKSGSTTAEFVESPVVLEQGQNTIGDYTLNVVANGGSITVYEPATEPIPEPATWIGLLSAIGAAGLGLVIRRRRHG